MPVPSPGPSTARYIETHARVAADDPPQVIDAGVPGAPDAPVDGPADLPPLPDGGVPLDAPAIAK